MNLFDQLDEDNFVLFAARHYYSPRCIDAEEFYDDLSRFKYVKRLVNRYGRGGDLAERLLLNHLTVILNVFGTQPALKMLEYKITKYDWPILKPFLVMLKAIEPSQYTDIKMDETVIDKLRRI
jgi:hypothetical protein